MHILFIHQNFPGQFVHVARALAESGHTVHALGLRSEPCQVAGVRYHRYAVRPAASPSSVRLLHDMEVKLIRAQASAAAMQALKQQGLQPEVIVAHPGWGEALFCKDVWPEARLVVLAEFFYSVSGADFGFDPEFSQPDLAERQRLRLKNTVHLHALSAADAIYAPTQWQRQQLPPEYLEQTQVAFEGIDTAIVRPDPRATLTLRRDGLRLAKGDEVLTFVARNLEPCRGFHIFMRALPALLRQRPRAHALIIGGDEISYGKPPAQGGTWRQVLMAEVGAGLPMDRVHFLGRLDYKTYLRVLQVSTCHVYLSYPFVLSWSCLEAMAAGCVLVASATPPVQEVIADGCNGHLFDFFNPQALADKAAAVLADQPARQPLSERARETVVSRYDLHAVCLPRQVALILGTRTAQGQATD
jgi:glycosyltransferase involved in cell wall biosynthesis